MHHLAGAMASNSSDGAASTVNVVCGDLVGEMNVATMAVSVANVAGELSPADFERIAGRGLSKKWKSTIRVSLHNALRAAVAGASPYLRLAIPMAIPSGGRQTARRARSLRVGYTGKAALRGVRVAATWWPLGLGCGAAGACGRLQLNTDHI
jgi:hypothetical protein